MPEASSEELENALREVPRDQDVPRVIFPYGFKIVEFKGEKVVCPMTPEEYKMNLSIEGIESGGDPGLVMKCVFSSEKFNCEWVECDGNCKKILGSSGWYCVCKEQ